MYHEADRGAERKSKRGEQLETEHGAWDDLGCSLRYAPCLDAI